jgi:nifR3 family TIM-barrel protein
MGLYHPVKIGGLELPGNLFLAPVAGYTDRAFRSICVDQGADFTCTELASSEALVRGGAKTFRIIERAANEKHYAVQLFGSDPDVMYRAALLIKTLKPDVVDINCGCPVPKVVKNGAGSALMKDPVMLGRITAAVVKAAGESLGGVPVTVKIRSGWDSSSLNYYECARAAVEEGAALVCLHPRTRGQGYSGKSDWSHIAGLVTRLSVPVAGSGDLFSPEDAERMLRETGCAAVMFARGAQGNPFIFKMTKDLLLHGSFEAPPFEERITAAFRQLELLAAVQGEKAACREMRKAFAAYTKGIGGRPGVSGGARLRDQLVHAETFDDYRSILSQFQTSGGTL